MFLNQLLLFLSLSIPSFKKNLDLVALILHSNTYISFFFPLLLLALYHRVVDSKGNFFPPTAFPKPKGLMYLPLLFLYLIQSERGIILT